MIRIAAVGDVHVGHERDDRFATDVRELASCADVLLLAGDLTRHGEPGEAANLAAALAPAEVPVLAVLGNHDHHAGCPEAVVATLREVGVNVLDGTSATLDLAGGTLGVAGTKGFGGGFAGACATEFGEPEMKAFVAHTRSIAATLGASLAALEGDARVVLLHYSPVEDTLRGERPEIFPFLGSYLLAEVIDAHGADLVLHGHAHKGTERGVTPGGIRVRNVARPLIRKSFQLFEIEPETTASRRRGAERPDRRVAQRLAPFPA